MAVGADLVDQALGDGAKDRIALRMAERIIKSVKEPYMIDQTEIRIGVSIGCSFGPIDGATVDDLILKADLALYQAKDAGRGVARYFSSELQSEQDDRVRLETDLRQAISAQQFHLVFQPLINAKSQKLIGFEALIRWNHPQRGFVPPNIFIPVAEENGLMPQIGAWVIDEACRAISTWPDSITVAVNISPKQILIPALPNVVSEALGKHKIPGNRLELEVTEGVFLGDSGKTVDVLGRLRALGVGIALDDFGTGYSSIGYLNKAIFHKLKIDGSFVREAGSRRRTSRSSSRSSSSRRASACRSPRKVWRLPKTSSACVSSAATRSRVISLASLCPTSALTRWLSDSAPRGSPANPINSGRE